MGVLRIESVYIKQQIDCLLHLRALKLDLNVQNFQD